MIPTNEESARALARIFRMVSALFTGGAGQAQVGGGPSPGGDNGKRVRKARRRVYDPKSDSRSNTFGPDGARGARI